ncbi:biotin-dependent carboxyltransferase family protein [Gracilibacillus sp. S3-1-1]|uniref:Biotin-dependent carboxyltransferase family protein n=1 Tax=Gracilibacillus pellucidus TaxID=3095368 RepID=A0ACC6M9Q0_9BACI|nr:biotin-dependent carboxyltransferase family protein [Gracilibacillus sp. S3-1-1]MDX8047582.1 biotin-dependent carboxyltransferase family protein [Gracilibacillus sp. S3-1-1]
MMTIKKAGLLTTIQDLGRRGFQKYGVIASGVMDTFSHRVANILVGNKEEMPTLEMTLIGPTIQFDKDVLIAICGGDLSATIEGEKVALWRPVFVKAHTELKFGNSKEDCRAYLAVAGGFEIPTVMNSRSTYIRASIGGFKGRALQVDDELTFGEISDMSQQIITQLQALSDDRVIEEKWMVDPDRVLEREVGQPIRFTKGREFHLFTEASKRTFLREEYLISTQSDRMGYRLEGEKLSLAEEAEMISEAVNFGTIQVPADGNPIILLADRQTTGGYPKIGQVISVDLPVLAQAKPGDRIRFVEISLAEAQRLYIKVERKIAELKCGMKLKYCYMGG